MVILQKKFHRLDEHPQAKPLGERWYGITFSTVQKFVML